MAEFLIEHAKYYIVHAENFFFWFLEIFRIQIQSVPTDFTRLMNVTYKRETIRIFWGYQNKTINKWYIYVCVFILLFLNAVEKIP